MLRDTVTENFSGHGLRYSFKNICDRHWKAYRETDKPDKRTGKSRDQRLFSESKNYFEGVAI